MDTITFIRDLYMQKTEKLNYLRYLGLMVMGTMVQGIVSM